MFDKLFTSARVGVDYCTIFSFQMRVKNRSKITCQFACVCPSVYPKFTALKLSVCLYVHWFVTTATSCFDKAL